MNILIVAPHADDEVLGCGGIMSKYTAEGHKVYVAIMTNAATGAPELFNQAGIDFVRSEALKAHKILGVTETVFFDFPAPRLETSPSYVIANELDGVYRRFNIDVVYLPHRGDIHKDHGVIFTAGLVAARPINNSPVKRIYTYETLSETEWAPPFGSDVFIPNVFVNIDGHVDNKIEAMKCFTSQIKAFPHSRSIEAIRALALSRGVTVGFPAAEAFFLIREITA